jgi:hypothetical protein
VLSQYYLFAVTGSLIWHTKENHVPTVDLKTTLNFSVWNWCKLDWVSSDPLARTSGSWVWGRRNVLITMWTKNLHDGQSTHTHSSFGIKWISCNQNATETFKIQKDCPQGAHTFFTLWCSICFKLAWPSSLGALQSPEYTVNFGNYKGTKHKTDFNWK